MIKMFNLLFQMNALVYAGLEDIARFKHLCLGLSTLLADMTDWVGFPKAAQERI